MRDAPSIREAGTPPPAGPSLPAVLAPLAVALGVALWAAACMGALRLPAIF